MGIEVQVGVEEILCKKVNAPFIFRVIHKRPYVLLWLHLTNIDTKTPNSIDGNKGKLYYIYSFKLIYCIY
jgi:hypothetical protein